MGGFVPEMKSGDVLGHECMGEVVEVGRDNKRLKVGDRVVIPFLSRLRRMPHVQDGTLFVLRAVQPEREGTG